MIWQSRASKEPADVGGTYVGGSLRVGNFSEQVWGDSDERDQCFLGEEEGGFFQERPVHLQLRVLLAQPRELDPLGLGQGPVTGVLA